MEVGDDDLCASDIVEHIVGYDFARFVVAIWIVGLEHAEPIADRQAWGDDQEPARVGFARWASDGIDGLPGDEHRHDGCFACTGGEFERQARQVRIGFLIDPFEILQEPFAVFGFRGDFGKPNRCLDRFDLAEERADTGELVGSPVLQKSCGFWGDVPLGWVGDLAPKVHESADLVDRGGRFVRLGF